MFTLSKASCLFWKLVGIAPVLFPLVLFYLFDTHLVLHPVCILCDSECRVHENFAVKYLH